MPGDVQTLLQEHAQAVEGYLRARLASVTRLADVPPRLVEAIHYSLLAGGKRLRPALVLEVHSTLAGSGEALSPLPAAAAVELIHTFSLVHDDLPAMDDDDLRRGRPTNHRVFGEALAILAGDSMTTLAFELLAVEYQDHPGVAAKLIAELARASGPAGMIGGQVLDMAAEGREITVDELRDVHRRKTGALLTCACRMGAIVAGAEGDALARITTFGAHLGLAFQIADDLLDVSSTAAEVGKATNKDAAAGKNTYPSLLGESGARAVALSEAEAAVAVLSTFGPDADGLRNLALFSAERVR